MYVSVRFLYLASIYSVLGKSYSIFFFSNVRGVTPSHRLYSCGFHGIAWSKGVLDISPYTGVRFVGYINKGATNGADLSRNHHLPLGG